MDEISSISAFDPGDAPIVFVCIPRTSSTEFMHRVHDTVKATLKSVGSRAAVLIGLDGVSLETLDDEGLSRLGLQRKAKP